MSMVTFATTSSPVFAFLASTVLVSCTGITLPGAMRVGCCAGIADCDVCGALVCACGWGVPEFDDGLAFCASATPHIRAINTVALETFFMKRSPSTFAGEGRTWIPPTSNDRCSFHQESRPRSWPRANRAHGRGIGIACSAVSSYLL